MSDINPLGSSFYFSGLQNATNKAAQDAKTEKTNNKSKISFKDALKNKESAMEFELTGLPPEIADMTIEDAAIYLKDKVDLSGDKFAESSSPENILEFKTAVQQFIKFVIYNNFEVTVNSRKLRKPRKTLLNSFSTYSLPPKMEDKKVKIQVINEKLDALTRDMLMNQQNNLKTLNQMEEIKGLIIDFLSS